MRSRSGNAAEPETRARRGWRRRTSCCLRVASATAARTAEQLCEVLDGSLDFLRASRLPREERGRRGRLCGEQRRGEDVRVLELGAVLVPVSDGRRVRSGSSRCPRARRPTSGRNAKSGQETSLARRWRPSQCLPAPCRGSPDGRGATPTRRRALGLKVRARRTACCISRKGALRRSEAQVRCGRLHCMESRSRSVGRSCGGQCVRDAERLRVGRADGGRSSRSRARHRARR
jgi:hypothetical protein